MANAENDRPDAKRQSFEVRGQRIVADRNDRLWTLRVGDRIVKTRDLSRGVDELVGPARTNIALVLRILEADAERRR